MEGLAPRDFALCAIVEKLSATPTQMVREDWQPLRDLGFDDSAWASGPAQLGYGDSDEATVISFGPNANNKFPTSYFRHGFEVADPSAVGALTLRVIRDDGCAVYLNGAEVARSNMPAGPIVFNTLASATVFGADESTLQEFAVDPALLVAGTNVVAVEVHQAHATSSDVSFDLELESSP